MTISDAAKRAMEMGLGGICISDHYDFDVPTGAHDFIFDVDIQQAEISRTRKELGLKEEGFQLLYGIEVGVQAHCMKEIHALMEAHKFDSVVASLHFIEGKDPYHGNYYIPYAYHEAYSRYLEEIYRCISLFDDFDILGHFDYIARYAPYPQATVFYSEFSDVFDRIFSLLISRGKTFEINTKTYQLYRGREPHLDINLLKRFREMGGEAISFGSDAHVTERIGEHFEIFRALSLDAGIKYAVWFKDRKPQYIKL